MGKIIIPAYLKPGDLIGITCPAGFMETSKAEACIRILQEWGFEVMVGKTLGSTSNNYFSGNDEERRDELQAMLDDSSISAILFGRGGYGMARIIDDLNFRKFSKNPKWLIGYSDITVLHSHILSNYNIATLHAPMAAAFNDQEEGSEFISILHQTITGKKLKYRIGSSTLNRKGQAEAILVGGNLSLLATVIGTRSDLSFDKKILFIEEIGEYSYSIDRLLYQLKRAGKLKKLAGLIVGSFTDIKETVRPYGKPVPEIISDIVAEYEYPVCFDFPVGHTPRNTALKIGGAYSLKVTPKSAALSEL